jgi:hypothetical protein
MDVVWGETAGVTGQLWVFYPLLFTLQGFQFFIGLLLLRTAVLEDESEWQACSSHTCGVCLFLCFASWTLILAVLDKSGLLLEAL